MSLIPPVTPQFAFWFLIAALAVYRVSAMVALEEGPFSVFLRIREAAGQTTWIGRGVNCTLCLSFWFGLVAALWLSWRFFLLPDEALAMWLALSAVTVLLKKWLG